MPYVQNQQQQHGGPVKPRLLNAAHRPHRLCVSNNIQRHTRPWNQLSEADASPPEVAVLPRGRLPGQQLGKEGGHQAMPARHGSHRFHREQQCVAGLKGGGGAGGDLKLAWACSKRGKVLVAIMVRSLVSSASTKAGNRINKAKVR
jgi:hypothetical protein